MFIYIWVRLLQIYLANDVNFTHLYGYTTEKDTAMMT